MNFPVSRQAAAVSLALALISSTAIAEVADTVVVTATRTPQLAADLIADTTVINAEEIARSGAGSVADILQRQRGIEIARNGPAGTTTSVYVRGANANLTLTEKFTRVAPDRVLYQFTAEDPTVWSEAWSGEYEFGRATGEVYEYACHEGNYGLQNILAGARMEERDAAAKPAGQAAR